MRFKPRLNLCGFNTCRPGLFLSAELSEGCGCLAEGRERFTFSLGRFAASRGSLGLNRISVNGYISTYVTPRPLKSLPFTSRERFVYTMLPQK